LIVSNVINQAGILRSILDKASNHQGDRVAGQAAASFWLLAHQLSLRTEAERLANIQTGFAASWVRAVREAFKLGYPQLEGLLNASASTLERRQRTEQALDAVASERLDRVAFIAIQALKVFDNPERAAQWMLTLNSALGDQVPLQLCETGLGARQVRRALSALECGAGI